MVCAGQSPCAEILLSSPSEHPFTHACRDEDRLAALREYGILDTPGEQDFDDLVRLVAHVCQTPVAVINFIDRDRQWFKSEVGLGVRETPLDASICAHAILEREVLVVPDTQEDERFKNNPLVVGEPYLRFYAGALLKAEDGHALGTLCVLDHRPRDLTDGQQEALRALARQVMSQLELRRALAAQARESAAREQAESAVRQSEARFAAMFEASLDCIIGMDHEGRVTAWNAAAERTFGYAHAEAVGQEMAGLIIPPALREAHRKGLARYLASGAGPILGRRLELTAIRKSGDEFPVELTISPVSVDGVQLFRGQLRDLTEQKRAEAALRQATEATETVLSRWQAVVRSMAEGVVVADAAGNIPEWNAAALEMHGYASLEEVRKHLNDFPAVFELISDDGSVVPLSDWPMSRVLRGETFSGYEVNVRRLDADVRRVISYSGSPVLDADGRVTLGVLTLHDITERKATEAALRESEAQFRLMADALPQIIWVTDADGSALFFNKQWTNYTGVPYEPTTATEVTARFIHDEDGPATMATFAEAQGTGGTFRVEHRIRSAMGEYRWFLVRADPYRDPQTRRITRWFGASTDIHDRKVAEARHTFLLALDDAVRPLTDAPTITATYARMLGEHLGADRCAYADVEADEDTFNLTGDYNRGVPSIVGRYRFAAFGDEVLRLMRADEPYVAHDVDEHQPPLGDLTAYRSAMIQAVICVPLHKGGRFVAAMAVHQRVPRRWTPEEVNLVRHVAARCWESIERTRAERAVRDADVRLRAINNTLPAFVWTGDPDGKVFNFNDRWHEYTGLTAAESEGFGWVRALHPDDVDRCVRVWEATRDEGGDYEIDVRYRRHDGAYRWYLARAVPVRRQDDSEITGWVGTSIDIDDLRRAEGSLRESEEQVRALLEAERAARAEAERAGRMKDEFLATLSHELRTPLNAILGWSQIIKRQTASTDDLAQGIDVIERNARAQAQIIEDLLDMSRIISGKVRLDVQRLSMEPILRAALASATPAADAKGIRIQAVLDPLAGPVNGDPARLQQVFWNLLTNAVKFTPKGGRVQVVFERVNSHLEISVADTGEGIRPEFLPHVFDRFRQADASTTRRHGGLGLGLSIVKQLVELHGGSVRAKSAGEGQGATFIVSLPLAVIHPESQPEPERRHPKAGGEAQGLYTDMCAEIAGVKVLVVDDEPDARTLVKRLLEDCNAVVFTAASAAEALETLQVERPDVLVSDVGMPTKDGYEFMKQVRALPENRGGKTPALALTAYARAEDRMRAIRTGFQMHVPKPVEPAELITMIASLAGRA
jgi:hypothetical protein